MINIGKYKDRHNENEYNVGFEREMEGITYRAMTKSQKKQQYSLVCIVLKNRWQITLIRKMRIWRILIHLLDMVYMEWLIQGFQT